eukprot:TRINITY_DN18331_c0_g2_i1.p1 TRINITY_DN18331_c0_g2~~TRINITY_DN18331_c0_g2_i1.p1  ORF type:complete len:314 (+),score=59.87 TRINITY_DN18331_c0_g2_i1:125-943(+)
MAWTHKDKPGPDEELGDAGFLTTTSQLRARRLLYLPRMLKEEQPALECLLHMNESYGGSQKAWWSMIDDDFRWLLAAASTFEELGDPGISRTKWLSYVKEHPKMWARQVKKVMEDCKGSLMDMDLTAYERKQAAESHACQLCCASFGTVQGLRLHQATKHNRRTPAKRFLTASGFCHICLKELPNPTRCLQHWQQGWRRRGGASCFAQMVLQDIETTPEEALQALEVAEATRQRSCKMRGEYPNKGLHPTRCGRGPQPLPVLGPLPRWAYEV